MGTTLAELQEQFDKADELLMSQWGISYMEIDAMPFDKLQRLMSAMADRIKTMSKAAKGSGDSNKPVPITEEELFKSEFRRG